MAVVQHRSCGVLPLNTSANNECRSRYKASAKSSCGPIEVLGTMRFARMLEQCIICQYPQIARKALKNDQVHFASSPI